MSESNASAAQSNLPAVVGADSRVIEISGDRKVTVTLCKVRHIGKVAKIIGAMVAVLSTAGVSFEKGEAQRTVERAFQEPEFLFKLLSELADETYGLMAILSSLSLEEVMDLNLEDAVILLSAILQDNYRFFVEKVAPMVSRMLPQVANKPAQ